jgi:hypothetical protein
VTESLIAKIKHRVLELMIVKDVSRAEATKIAAKEYGRTIKDTTAKPRKSTHATHASSSNIREELFARIMGMHDRIIEAEARPRGPEGMIKRAIARIRLKEDIETAVAPTPPPTPVEPPSPTMLDAMCGVYTGRSSQQLIPDDEFPVGLVDQTSVNWRKSLEASKPRTPQDEINPLDEAAVEAALQKQQAQIIAFPRVSK